VPEASATFNWALEWFDVAAGTALELPGMKRGAALQIRFVEFSARSDTVASWLHDHGAAASGTHIRHQGAGADCASDPSGVAEDRGRKILRSG
jgi:hypothetical protein